MSLVAQGAVVVLNGIDLSCYLKNIKPSQQQDLLDCTALCQTGAKTYQPGLVERTIDADGFFKHDNSVTANDIDGLFNTALANTASDYLLSIGAEGGAAGAVAIIANIKQIAYNVDSVTGQLILTTFQAKVTKTATAEGFRTGAWLYYGTATGSVNGTTFDNLAASLGYIGQIHVLGGGDALVTIQHSTDGSTWVDLLAQATYANNTATQIALTSGTTRRYIRAVVNQSSGTTTVAVTFRGGYTG